MLDKESYDFGCWVIKYGTKSINDRIYQNGAIQVGENFIVPLLWNHQYNDPMSVLGHALLENRDDGIYTYCTLSDIPINETIKQLLRDRGSVSLSPYINQVKYDKKYITHGIIREVSLVFARIDPDEAYYPIVRQ